MKFPFLRRQILVTCFVASFGIGLSSVPATYAFGGDWLGTLIGGAVQYKAVDDMLDYYNETEQGRQELFAQMKAKYGVADDPYRTARLDNIIARVSEGISHYDDTIREKPYLYFLNPDTTFNAFCSYGRVISVNTGLFDLTSNEDEAAVVIAHEMGHGEKSHTASGMRKKVISAIGANVALSSMGGDILKGKLLDVLVTQYNQVQVTKKMEWEADNLAMDYITAAGYNPGACAALWQRVEEWQGNNRQNFVGEIFSPSDHPTNSERRLNYEKRLTKLSDGHVTVKDNTIEVNKKMFLSPAPLPSMSSAERKYFLMGNLAAAYKNGHAKEKAYVRNGTVMLGPQAIMTPAPGDPSAENLADLLNRIK